MKYFDLLLNSARQAITNKISWLYIFIALLGQIIPSVLTSLSTRKLLSAGIWFLTSVLLVIFISGLVYSVSQKEIKKLDTSFLDAWRKGWSKIIQVGLINILFLTVLLIFLFLIGVLFRKIIPYGLLRTIIFALVIRPIQNFSVCAIVINNLSTGASVKTSVLMFIRNALQILAISGILIVIQQILLSVIVLVFMSPYRDMLFTSPFKMLEIPQVMFYDQVLALILFPWIVIVFTHLYLRFIDTSVVVVLSADQKAA